MNCEEAKELIGPYQDGELSVERQAAVAAHLDACPSCSSQLASDLRLSRAIRELAPTYPAPEGLRSWAAQRSAQSPRAGFLAGALAFGLPLAFLLGFVLWVRPGRDYSVALVSDHVRSLMASHLIDVPSSDRHTVKPWFLGKLDFAPAVPDLAAQGFPLIGGRLDYIESQPAAALVYRRDRHIINVFVMKSSLQSTEDLNGYHAIGWRIGNLSYYAVSDVEKGQLEAFARDFQAKS